MGKKTFAYTGCENLEAMAEAKHYNDYLIQIITKAGATGKAKVLDFGAGSGTYTDLLVDKTGIKADCLEPDKTLQKTLKDKGYKVYEDISKLKPNTYDVIYALNVFEHIKDDGGILNKLKDSLVPGGRIVIYVPAFQMLYSTMDARVEHHRRYRKSRLRGFATEAGLKIEKLQYRDPLGFGAALLYKLSGKKDGTISPSSVKLYDRTAFPVSRVIEPLTWHLFGKNVVLVAQRPASG